MPVLLPDPPVEVWPTTPYPYYDILFLFLYYWSYTNNDGVWGPIPPVDASVLARPPARGTLVLPVKPIPVLFGHSRGPSVLGMRTYWTDNVPPDVTFVFTQQVHGGPPIQLPSGKLCSRAVLTWNGVVGSSAGASYKAAFYR